MKKFVLLIGTVMVGSAFASVAADARVPSIDNAVFTSTTLNASGEPRVNGVRAALQPGLPVNYEIACSGESVSYKLLNPQQGEYVLHVEGALFGDLSRALSPLHHMLSSRGGKGISLPGVTPEASMIEARIFPPAGYTVTAVLCPPIGCILQLETPSESSLALREMSLDNSVMQYA